MVATMCAGLVLPRLPKAALPLAVGTVGALIMPHNMYLQSAVVQSRYTPTNMQTLHAIQCFCRWYHLVCRAVSTQGRIYV